FGGNLDIEGSVDGDIALIGGNVAIAGEVDGDMVLVGGQANLASSAFVDGDIAMIGGNVNKEEGAEITGTVTNNDTPVFDVPNVPNAPNSPNVPDYRYEYKLHNPFWDIAGAFGWAIVVAAIGMVLMLFLQPQLERAGSAMTSQPFMAGGFGLLVAIVVPIAI